jgi:hypothetical protein
VHERQCKTRKSCRTFAGGTYTGRVECFDFEACLLVSAFQFTRGSALYRCYGSLAMCMIGCAGSPTPSKIRMYHTLVAAPAFLAIFTIGPSATVLR